MDVDLLYKFMPIGPHFRLNFMMLLERSAPFFARKSYFNDPVDCEPFLVLEISDDDLIAAAYRAAEDANLFHPAKTELTQLVSALNAVRAKGANLGTPHYHSLLGGISEATDTGATILGPFTGQSLREIAKGILKKYVTAQIAEPQVFSLSATLGQPTLWGHYADGHKGLCVGISGLRSSIKGVVGGDVAYSNRRPRITIDEVVDLEKDTPRSSQAIEKIFFNKSLDWQREDEYRLVARQVDKAFVFPELYFPEGSYLKLPGIRVESVIFGSQCSQQRLVTDMISQLSGGDTFPLLMQAVLAEGDYGLTYVDASERYGGRKPISRVAKALLKRQQTV